MTDYEKLYKVACDCLDRLVLDGILSIKDVPQDIRVSEVGRSSYITAFRVVKSLVERDGLIERYIEVLRLLYADIEIMAEDFYWKRYFEQMFVDNVWNEFIGGADGQRKLGIYRGSLPEAFLLGMSEIGRNYWKFYEDEFEARRLEE